MQIRVLTQNLYNGRAQPQELAAVLQRHSPDVVAVQELSSAGAEVLGEWGAATLLDPRDDTTGMGIALRGPANLDRIDFPFRNPVIASLDPQHWGDGLTLINAHLVNPIASPISRSLETRRRELAALSELLRDSTTPVLLVGDFNSSPAWPLYRRLRSVATDLVEEAGKSRRTWGPWPWFPRLLRIDHAFGSGVKLLDSQLIRIRGADHSGLLVDIELNR